MPHCSKFSHRVLRTTCLPRFAVGVQNSPPGLGIYATIEDGRLWARAQFERCTTIAPTFPDAWAHLAALAERAGDSRGAEQIVAAGLRNCPESPGLHLTRGRLFRDAGRANEAIEEYRASIRFRPDQADAHLELATTLFRLERVREGVTELQNALAAEPKHPMALALLALHAIGARDEPSARRWMGAVLDQPRVPREQLAQLLAAFREQFGREFR